MENLEFDVIVVGTGPAGIAVANTLMPGRVERVLIIDAGRSHRARLCPVDQRKPCGGCKGKCNVISGFGGALHYGDAAKFSLLPSGRRLIDLFGEKKASELCDAALVMLERLGLEPFFPKADEKQAIADLFHGKELHIRDYGVITASEAAVKGLIETAFADLRQRHLLSLRESLLDISRVGEAFSVTTTRRRTRAAAVVLATGRSGVTSTQHILRTLGATLTSPKPSLGVRFELPARYVQTVGKVFSDLKVSVEGPTGEKTKTFCFSAGDSGGRIKFCHYGNAFSDPYIFLDGHAVVQQPCLPDASANFAVMYQLPRQSGLVEDWLGPMLLDKYKRLSAGRPMVQPYSDFRSAQRSAKSWDQIRRQLRFRPSIEDLVAGPLFLLFDSRMREQICSTFERVFECCLIHSGDPIHLGDALADAIVVGPELEFFWDRVSIDDQCQASIPGLYVVGDAAGIAQGNLQAMMMGIAAGHSLSARFAGSQGDRADAGRQRSKRN